MLNLRATNNQLTINNNKYSFLSDNYLSGVSSFDIDNIAKFADEDYLLIGSFGNEISEIVQISGTPSGNTINLVSTFSFAHPESTKVTVISYNKVKYYRTTTTTYSAANPLPLPNPIDIQADSLYTVYSDTINSTGFGWYIFYNSTSTLNSQPSNAIPYVGFSRNSVKKILDNFYSLLNNKERKIITNADSLRYLNEGYGITINELNLVNNTYNVSDETDISVVINTKEYDLPANFSDIVSVYNSTDDLTIDSIDIKDISKNDEDDANVTKYYLRGNNTIGFSPTPTSAFTIKVRCKENSTELSTLYENIVLPENNYFILIDYMLYRAYMKLQNPRYMDHYKIFQENINRMKLVSFKRNGSIDAFSISNEANV